MDARWLPWINALRRHARQPSYRRTKDIEKAHETGVMWLEWRWVTREAQEFESWRLVFEALELLALAAHADQPLWRQVMTQWYPQAPLYWENEPLTRRFEVGCSVCVVMTGMLGLSCERFVCDDIDNVVSDAYKELRSALEAKLRDSADPPAKIVARVRVVADDQAWGTRDETPDALSPLLFEVVQLVGLQFAKENAPLSYTRRWPPLFRIEEVAADAFFSEHTPKDLAFLHRVALCGVQVQRLQLNNIEITQETAPLYTSMLQRMIAPEASDSSRGCSQTPALWLHRDATSQTYDGVFSALLHSKAVREVVHMIPEAEDQPTRTRARDRYWQWIAAAVFSSQATNSIDTVSLHGLEIDMEDAVALERTIQADNPLSILFPGCASDAYSSCVSASKFRLTEALDDEEPSSTLTTELPVTCQVLDAASSHKWLHVLLPGWGQAWVKRADATVVKSQVATTALGSSRVRSIERLAMDHPDDQDTEAVMKILCAVGSGVRCLELMNWNSGTSASSEWLNRVFQACPQLDVLEMSSIPIQSLDIFARGYEKGACRMKSLILDYRIDDIDTNGGRFFDCLADPGHVMAQHLRELEIQAIVERVPPGLFASIAAMLESNHFLAHLKVSVPVRLTEPMVLEPTDVALVGQIESHSGEPVAIRLGPLARRSKLAFLSAIWGSTSGTRRLPQALQSMDATAVGLIFQFAAECRKRKIEADVKLEVINNEW